MMVVTANLFHKEAVTWLTWVVQSRALLLCNSSMLANAKCVVFWLQAVHPVSSTIACSLLVYSGDLTDYIKTSTKYLSQDARLESRIQYEKCSHARGGVNVLTRSQKLTVTMLVCITHNATFTSTVQHGALQPCMCRGQCTHMLEDGEAMKAHAQLHGTYTESAAKGRPVLHAALQTEKLVGQLVGWATQMPLFAIQIIGQSVQTPSCVVAYACDEAYVLSSVLLRQCQCRFSLLVSLSKANETAQASCAVCPWERVRGWWRGPGEGWSIGHAGIVRNRLLLSRSVI